MKNQDISLYDLPGTPYQMAVQEVGDTTSVMSGPRGRVQTRPVPGYEKENYVPFGADNQLPYRLIDLVGADEVTAQNKLFNVLTCYGAGPRFTTLAGAPVVDTATLAWLRRQNLPLLLLEQMTDIKYYYYACVVLILSRDGRHINRIIHKDACHVRLQEADRRGRVRYIYYANWQDNMELVSGVERIPLLDETDPLGDLCRRLGLDAASMQPVQGARPTRDRKFAMLLRFPTAGRQYYPTPYWTAMLRGGSYDEKRMISAGKRAKLRNTVTVKYHVEIERNYWERICMEEGITDPVKMQERVDEEKKRIRDFVCGIENAGKAWISGYYVNPDGNEVHDIRISAIASPGGKEGGDWNEDVQAASNTICYSDNIHPNLVGAVPGKSQSNNSGSDKRELFVMKQALEIAFHDILLAPYRLAAHYNGMDVEVSLPMIQLTTLDQHKDAKIVKP